VCGARVPRAALAAHAAACGLRAVACATCGGAVAADAAAAHGAACAAARDVCRRCGASYARPLAAAHVCAPPRADARRARDGAGSGSARGARGDTAAAPDALRQLAADVHAAGATARAQARFPSLFPRAQRACCASLRVCTRGADAHLHLR
jgi:hypothetical protein